MNRGLGDDVSVQAVAEVNGVDVVAISVESARKFHFHGFGHGDNGGSFPRAHTMANRDGRVSSMTPRSTAIAY